MNDGFVVFEPCNIPQEQIAELLDKYPITREEAVYLIERNGFENISEKNINYLMINKIATENSYLHG